MIAWLDADTLLALVPFAVAKRRIMRLFPKVRFAAFGIMPILALSVSWLAAFLTTDSRPAPSESE